MNKNLFALILFIVFWSSFMIFTGTLTSGYHFTDDHEIITINKNVNDNGLINATISILKKDLDIRFRPFYYIHRIALVKLLGTNFLLWSIYNICLAVFTSYFLFLFIYNQGYKYVHALIFPFLTLIGAQSAIWWRLGPNETIGLFLLSISLFSLVNSIFQKKKYQLITSIIFLLLASISKESFALFIPAYIMLLVWYSYQRNNYKNILVVIRSYIFLMIVLLTVLTIEAYVIIFIVGTNKIGYAGIDSSFSIKNFVDYILLFLSHNVYVFLIFLGSLFLVINMKIEKIKFDLDYKKMEPFIFNLLILLTIIMPQFLLYNKSGIFERYLIPLNLGFALFILFILKNIEGKYSVTLFLRRVLIVSIWYVITSFLIKESIPNAKLFAKEGFLTDKFFSTIISHTTTNDSILIVLNGNENYEWGHSINQYLNHVADRKQFNFYNVNTQLNNDFERNLDAEFTKIFSNKLVKDMNNDYPCIAVLPFSTNLDVKNKLDSNNIYQRNDFEYFTVYTKHHTSFE